MKHVKFSAMAVLIAAAWCAPFASAQVQNINSNSGNGQLICPSCPFNGVSFLEPLVAKVTDAQGNPAPNVQVSWVLVIGQGLLGAPGSFGTGGSYTSTTDGNGLAQAGYFPTAFNLGTGATPFLQSQIQASTVNSVANFYETVTAPPSVTSNVLTSQLVSASFLTPTSTPPCPTCADPNDVANIITGPAGSTSAQQIETLVSAPGTSIPAVPNIELHLLPNQAAPTASCATGIGADPGTVMTDATGAAICSIVLGSTAGSGTFTASIGGAVVNQNDGYAGYKQTGNFNFKVTAGQPGSLATQSGNAQTANPGQALPLPLVAIVGDTNGNPLGGQAVTWSVTPAGAATLTSTSSTSDANGQVRTNATLTSGAVGIITITAALTANSKLAAVFTETANVQISGLSIVSGNNQSAIVNSGFASPLIVQLTTSAGTPTAGIAVQFTLTGPGTLSNTAATTASNGQAQTSVTAGGTTGIITVTAQAGGFSQAFSLTVIQSGPTLTASSFYNGADFQRGSISPCSIATIIGPGIAPTLQGTVSASMVGPLPYLMATDAVTVNGSQAPIYNVSNSNNQQQITIQIPCSVTPGTASVTVNVGGGTATVSVPVNPASPGLFGTPQTNGTYLPVLERPDGSFVTAQNPARRGETLIAFVTGLGATTPSVATNSVAIPGSVTTPQGTIIVGFAANGIPLTSAVMSPDLIGVFEVAFQIPTNAPTGNDGFSVGLLPVGSGTVYYSVLGTFPVQ